MLRASSMGAAFVAAAVKTNNKNWIQRAVVDRATHTSVGVVKERDVNLHLSRKTATQLGLIHKL